MDCEGAKYHLIADPRFAALNVISMVWSGMSTCSDPKRSGKFEMPNRPTLEKLVWESGVMNPSAGSRDNGIALAFKED